ncbi:PTS fructose transporter subunit IIA, partial [Peribacillus sp. SIMBA_075]
EALSRLATFLMDEKFRVNILEAESKQQVLEIVSAKEAEVDGPEPTDSAAPLDAAQGSAAGGKILAVTACPTGIAHTYMAAEKLSGRAKERG